MSTLNCIEFNTQPIGGKVEVRDNDKPIYILTENDRELVSPLYEMIRTRYPHAYADLCAKYKESIENIWYFEFKVVNRFIKCNWNQFDNKWDIDENGDWQFEFCMCPLLGECKSEGRICRPQERRELLESEIKVLRLIVNGKKTVEIANELYISPKTVEAHVYNMLRKLGLHSNSQLVDYWYRHGIK